MIKGVENESSKILSLGCGDTLWAFSADGVVTFAGHTRLQEVQSLRLL